MSWSLISVIKMVTIPDSFHPSAHFRDDRTMHGACPTVKGIKWVCFTGDILCSRKYSNAFVQETMYCNASVQESLLEVGVQQVGEGGSPDLEETLHLKPEAFQATRDWNWNWDLERKPKSVPPHCLGNWLVISFTHFSIKENKELLPWIVVCAVGGELSNIKGFG